jgi:hypothetical protein
VLNSVFFVTRSSPIQQHSEGIPELTPDYPSYDYVSNEQATDKKRMNAYLKAFERLGVPVDFQVSEFFMSVGSLI